MTKERGKSINFCCNIHVAFSISIYLNAISAQSNLIIKNGVCTILCLCLFQEPILLHIMQVFVCKVLENNQQNYWSFHYWDETHWFHHRHIHKCMVHSDQKETGQGSAGGEHVRQRGWHLEGKLEALNGSLDGDHDRKGEGYKAHGWGGRKDSVYELHGSHGKKLGFFQKYEGIPWNVRIGMVSKDSSGCCVQSRQRPGRAVKRWLP